LNICIPGDYIGEMCLLDPDRSRTASVRTSSPVKLLELTRADLDTLLHSYPIIGYAMARVLSQRLKASETKMLAELNRKNSQLSQAYSYLQSMLPQLTEIKRVGKQENKGHFTLPPDFDIQDNTIPLSSNDYKLLKKTRKVRQEIYRSGRCQINIETFGGFRLYRGVTGMDEKEWYGYMPKLLLKAIITHGSHRAPKDQLIEALWPEITPESGERNFKTTLHRLRKALEPEMDRTFGSSYVYLKANMIYLNEDLCKIDLNDFLSLYSQGERKEREGNIEAALVLYKKAIDLYRGDFLSEELYISWIGTKREELQKLYISLLYKIADIQEKQHVKGCHELQKDFQIDPFRAGLPEADDTLLK